MACKNPPFATTHGQHFATIGETSKPMHTKSTARSHAVVPASLPTAFLTLGLSMAVPLAAWGQGCLAKSDDVPPAVVELYTSEGCSSCPPADQWLSTLKGKEGVLALSFHVNYWNHLGWKDPFATEATTQRQHQIKQALGAAYVYTPQVLLNGKDHRLWRLGGTLGLAPLPAGAAPGVQLQRVGSQVTARVAPAPAHPSLAAYWAVLQDGLANRVTRGENAGETLRHDHVVSYYQPVPSWPGQAGQVLQLTVPTLPAAQTGTAQRIVLVVTDNTLTQPVQAVALSCS